MKSTSPPGTRHPATSAVRRKPVAMPGFRVPPKPKPRPIEELTIRELRDIYNRNTRVLAQPAPSTSAYVPRLQAEQARIESRLLDLEGIEQLGSTLKHTKLRGEDDMSVDSDPEPPAFRTLEAKRHVLSKAGAGNVGGISLQQAIQMEQEAQARDRERKQRQLDKRLKHGLPMEGESLTRGEREGRIWAFMNHKPTESDLEDDDDDDDDDDDEDPANWFVDDQDDGRKGQDIIEPDPEGLSDIICIDERKINYTFYEPREI